MTGSSELPSGNRSSNSPGSDEAAEARDTVPDNSSVPKPKRLACMICRKRKLKCDGIRPSCSTCSRLGHDCSYDEQRRKSGPKRGYVKALEERLKHVETLLKTQDGPAPTQPQMSAPMNGIVNNNAPPTSMGMTNGSNISNDHEWRYGGDSPAIGTVDGFNNFGAGIPTQDVPMTNMGSNFTWEMIGLGLEEPLPPQETIDELHQVYFEKVHASIPMIHRARYLSAMNLAPHQRPPVCLRYAMWTMACSITEKYSDLKDLFYQRARKYIEGDYVKGFGEHMISVAHCQTHILLACYEMKMMYFPRAWVNTGSAVRLAQMMGLHRIDGAALDVKQCLPPANDWTEREERRRTFWMAFCEDRYASIGTGWPMIVDERDISTRLPSSEEAFDMSRPEQTITLDEGTTPAGAAKLSSFGGIILLAALFGRNLVHLHRPDPNDQDGDLNGPFWNRHRDMDNILLNTSLNLPPHLKLPAGLPNPNVIFTNMSVHTSTICLHQAAIFKAEQNKMPSSISMESKMRCITAAGEIASIMRTISHMDLSAMNPFISFCLYVSARVFVQFLKSRPDDDKTVDSLRFLLSAMHALKRRNPLTESFLVQLDFDFEALADKVPKLKNAFIRAEGQTNEGLLCTDPENVKGIFKYRDTKFGENDSPSPEPTESQTDAPGDLQAAELQAQAQAHVPNDLTPSSNGMFDAHKANGHMNGRDGISSPDGPTPNSSSSGGDRGYINMPGAANPMGMNGLSPNQQNLANCNPGFFSVPNSSFMANGTPQQYGGFHVTGQYQHLGMQDAIEASPGGEDMLKAILNMGPMDAMDLSSWGNGNEATKG